MLKKISKVPYTFKRMDRKHTTRNLKDYVSDEILLDLQSKKKEL